MFIGQNFGASILLQDVSPAAGETIQLDLGQTGDLQVPVVDGDGAAINLTGRTLRVVIDDRRRSVVQTVEDADVDAGDGSFSFTLGAAVAPFQRILRLRLLDVSGGAEVELLEVLVAVA